MCLYDVFMGELTSRDKKIIGGSVVVLLAAGAGAVAYGGDGGSGARDRAATADARLGAARAWGHDAGLGDQPARPLPAPAMRAPAPGAAPGAAPDAASGPLSPEEIDPATIWTLTPAGPVRTTAAAALRGATTRPVPAATTVRPQVTTAGPVVTPPVPTPTAVVVPAPVPTTADAAPPVVVPDPIVVDPPRQEPVQEPVPEPPAPEPDPVVEEPAMRVFAAEPEPAFEPEPEPEPNFDSDFAEPMFSEGRHAHDDDFPWEPGTGGLPDPDTFDFGPDAGGLDPFS